ncbi:MAG: ferrous iron transport protein A [Candidatus Omnitrophica bacterium]|nr:ferrous iron transport protein A [Candidatus Omnitrophota bacterium]
MISLDKLATGSSAKVISVEGGTNLKDRLHNLGVKEGMVVKKITGSSWRGPVVVTMGRTQVALGVGMASKVMVEPVEKSIDHSR